MYLSSEELSQIRQNRLSGRYRFVEYRRRSRRGKDNFLVRLVSDATRFRYDPCRTATANSNSKFPPTAGKAVISSNGSRLRSIWRASRSTRIRKSPSSKRNGLLKQRIAGSWTTSRSPRPNKLRSTLSSRQTAVDLHEQRRRPLLFRCSRTPRGAGEAPSQFYLRKYFSITKKLSIFE